MDEPSCVCGGGGDKARDQNYKILIITVQLFKCGIRINQLTSTVTAYVPKIAIILQF